MFKTLQGSLSQPAPDVDAMEPRSDSSAASEDPLESEGTEPSGEYPRHALADWTDDDEEASFCSDAAFEGDSDEVQEVTGPLPSCGRRQGGGATAADEAAGKKGKGATASRPASKRPAPGPPAGQRADGAKRRRGGGRWQVPVVAGYGFLLFSLPYFEMNFVPQKLGLIGRRRMRMKTPPPRPSEPTGQRPMLPIGSWRQSPSAGGLALPQPSREADGEACED